MLWAHGLVCHPDPRIFGCSFVWRTGLHPQQKGRVDSPLLQQLWERSLCGRCCQPRNEHKKCWARLVERAAMFTVADLFPLKPVILLIPCHMLLGLLLLIVLQFLFCIVVWRLWWISWDRNWLTMLLSSMSSSNAARNMFQSHVIKTVL